MGEKGREFLLFPFDGCNQNYQSNMKAQYNETQFASNHVKFSIRFISNKGG